MIAVRRKLAEVRLSIRAERASRLGLIATLAFSHFLSKYREDQPRDGRGRWTGAGSDDVETTISGVGTAERDVETTGSVAVRKYRTGDPRIDDVTSILEEKVGDALEQIGPGRGPDYGREVHVAFATAVAKADIPGIRSHGIEVTFFEGTVSPYGTHGSVRTDIIMRSGDDPLDRVIAVWDLKTGSATLSPSRAAQIRQELRIGSDIPVIELHAIRGVSVKSRRADQFTARIQTLSF